MNEILQPLLAPVVIISACGLLCLAQFARFTALVGRVRDFHKQRFETMSRVNRTPNADHELDLQRCEALGVQAESLLRLAALIRVALMLLVATVICMILCSLSLGLAHLLPSVGGPLSLGFFVLGLVCMLGGMAYVFIEIAQSLNTVTTDHESLSHALKKALARAHDPPRGDE